jgi:hypothetical protein
MRLYSSNPTSAGNQSMCCASHVAAIRGDVKCTSPAGTPRLISAEPCEEQQTASGSPAAVHDGTNPRKKRAILGRSRSMLSILVWCTGA